MEQEEEIKRRLDWWHTKSPCSGVRLEWNSALDNVEEQIEEESTASDIHQRITMIGDDHPMLFTLDTELAARTFTDPFAACKG